MNHAEVSRESRDVLSALEAFLGVPPETCLKFIWGSLSVTSKADNAWGRSTALARWHSQLNCPFQPFPKPPQTLSPKP